MAAAAAAAAMASSVCDLHSSPLHCCEFSVHCLPSFLPQMVYMCTSRQYYGMETFVGVTISMLSV
jgi:hypothetical protein